MVKPDVIVVNPSSVDYPLWRHTMEQVRDQLGQVIVVHYNDYKGASYSDFVRGAMPWATHVAATAGPGDWRNLAVHSGLAKSQSEWVVFMEQDFLPAFPAAFFGLLRMLPKYSGRPDVLGWWDGDVGVQLQPLNHMTRLHPSLLMVNRQLIESTSRDFGAHTEKGHDHFGLFTEELKASSARIVSLAEQGVPKQDWHHWAGITHNFHLVMRGEAPCHNVEEFKRYVRLSLDAPVQQHPNFVALCQKCLTY